MSRIVVVFPDPPLPFGNAAARWYYVLLRGLVERGHEVVAFAVHDDARDVARTRELFPASGFDVRLYPRPPRRPGPWSKLRTLRRPHAGQYGDDLRRDLEAELARGFDALHLEQLWGGWLALGHAGRAIINVQYLFEIDRSDARPPALSGRGLLEAATVRAEHRLLRHFPTITTLSPRLADHVRRIAPGGAVHVVPLAIDASLYAFDAGAPPAGLAPPTIGLIGSFNWTPTISAGTRLLTRLWPEIRRRVPGARLQIVGRRAVAAMGGLAGASGPDVSLFEDVPDTTPYFRSTDVLLYAPGPASGMKVKVLEACLLGTPVVTNADGVEGLPAEDGVHAGICQDDAGLVDRAVALLGDPARRDRQRRAARALVESHCGPGPVLDRLERVYRTLPGAASATAARRTE